MRVLAHPPSFQTRQVATSLYRIGTTGGIKASRGSSSCAIRCGSDISVKRTKLSNGLTRDALSRCHEKQTRRIMKVHEIGSRVWLVLRLEMNEARRLERRELLY
jgi:hypothetical protein